MPNEVNYLAPPSVTEEEATLLTVQASPPILLRKRSVDLGWVVNGAPVAPPSAAQIRNAWDNSDAIVLPGATLSALPDFRHDILAAETLYLQTLEGLDCNDLLAQPPYAQRLEPQFEPLASFQDEGDPQHITTVEFDIVHQDEIIAENIWVRLSWLSFDEEDLSLRFRFSFGIADLDHVDDDFQRQQWAASLAEALFPESQLITQNSGLIETLSQTLGIRQPQFVERIVYFNAPNGGARFHQDVERGHLGVVYAQVTGKTLWFALPKHRLIALTKSFLENSKQLYDDIIVASPVHAHEDHGNVLDRMLDDAAHNDALLDFIDTTPEFAAELCKHGYAYLLEPGDIILLPQHNLSHCAWHAVFCVDDQAGEGLSFAVREHPTPLTHKDQA